MFSDIIPVKHLTAGLKGNNTLQELDVYLKPSENDDFKEFFEATNNQKGLALSFPSCELMYLYIVPHVTNMLNRNEDMKFLTVSFIPNIDITFQDDWVQTVHQFWKTVLLHLSLSYV